MSVWFRVPVATPSATVRPSRMTVTRSVMAKISSSRCDTKTRLRSSSRRVAITSNSRSTSPGLSDEVGSSKMINSAFQHQRLGDFDQLALGGGKVADLDIEIQRVALAQAFKRLGGATAHRGVGQAGPARRQTGRKMFSSNRQVVRQIGLLHDDGDSGAERIARGRFRSRGASLNVRVPASGGKCPAMTFERVDFPAPLAPIRA